MPVNRGNPALSYNVTNISNPALFEVLPQIDTDGNLTYRPAADAFGVSTFVVTVQDDGGTLDGSNDTSDPQTFQIAVAGVNDAPSLTLGEATVREDSGPRTITGFANFQPGPNEDGRSNDSRIVHDEGADGTADPLSSDNNNPTDLGDLTHGSNIVRGHIDAAKTVGDVDVFTFRIDTGFQLDGLFVLEYEYVTPPSNPNERNAFLAINDADSFPYNAQELDLNQNPDLDEFLFLGGTVFGLDDLADVGGGNILPRAGVVTGRRFTPPLEAGIYTIYIQQTGPANTYALDFRVTETNKQSVDGYTISNISDPSLFSSLPQIDNEGNLTFTAAANANGTATFDVVVQDDGGTENGGVDQSAAKSGTITVTSVNDRPTFTASNPPAVLENSGSQSVSRFVASFDPGHSNESSQTALAYRITNVSNPALFMAPPTIDTLGNLAYEVAADAFGTSTFDVTVQDDGGTASGGVDTSLAQTFTITVKEELIVTYEDPDPIVSGTLLGAEQLDATANLPGSFVYTPAAGTELPVGEGQTLAATFTADDPFYEPVTVLASIDVVPPPVEFDFGDAPAAYPVTLVDDGARHIVGSLFFGGTVDSESDGQPSAAADADGGDEDGIVALADIVSVPGTDTIASFAVTASESGLLDAWIDFGGNGDWSDVGDQIANGFAVTAGLNTLSFVIPGNSVAGTTAARFRLSSAGGLSPTGEANDGEVEDYVVTIRDGGDVPNVSVDLVDVASTLVVSNDQLLVRGDNATLFRAPIENVGTLNLLGTASDETITFDLGGGSVIPLGGLMVDGNAGLNVLRIAGDGTFDLRGGTSLRQFAKIDLSDPTDNVIMVNAASIRALSPTVQSVMVVGEQDDAIEFQDAQDWRMGETFIVDGQFIRSAVRVPATGGSEALEIDLPHAWQNVIQVSDVNNSGDVTAGDALVIINELARRAFSDADDQFLVDPQSLSQWPGVYYDQNGDDKATALDALRVINELARIAPEGEEPQAGVVDQIINEWFTRSETDEMAHDDSHFIDGANFNDDGQRVRVIASFDARPASTNSRDANPYRASHKLPEHDSESSDNVADVDEKLSAGW